ncbi:fungal-specific transcription factor domain-containing protein [Xylariomycetidae sp. FL2044]|nr:fungal-specific transcription factor domain-containing protein [Xylariomycetidae sp. FL2044]
MPPDAKPSIHRFRVDRTEQLPGSLSSPRTPGRPRSASPPLQDQQQQQQRYGQEPHSSTAPAKSSKSIPACDRCRSFKKKCSRTFPVCALCASAGQRCSFSTPATSTAAQTHHLRARVEWLSKYINDSLPAGLTNIESVETGTDLSDLLQDASPLTHGTQNGTSPASATASGGTDLLSSHDTQPMINYMGGELNPDDTSVSSRGHHSVVQATAGSTEAASPLIDPALSAATGRLPSDAAARRFVDAYFRNVNRAYPFVDRNKVLSDLEVLGDFAKRRRDADSTLLYLIMAIGCTTLQRAGQIPSDTTSKFEVAYSDIIQECLCRESIKSIQILVLLALYSLFDASGASAWSIIGIVSRQAMLLGLSRRASDDKTLSATEIELRHRLFWSIYVLDRMMAASLGLPVALTDENMDCPFPGLTIDEFASPDRTQAAMILQTSRHVIQLRQIEGRILQQIHFRKHTEVTALTHADRRTIVQDIRAEVENWYSNGCLVSPLEPDNVPIHNSITWLSARYYYLLLLLYYPSHFSAPIFCRAELLRFAQKHLQSTSALFQQRQLPLNRVTLYRLMPVGLVLMHSFMTGGTSAHAARDVHGGASFPARDELAVLINILEAFSEGWTHAHRAARIFRHFLTAIGSLPSFGPLQFSQAAPPPYGGGGRMGGPKDPTYHNLLRPHLTSLLALMQEILGKASCYRFLELPDELPRGYGLPHAQQPLPSPLGPRSGMTNAAGISGGGDGDGDAVMYGWGPLDLDFL